MAQLTEAARAGRAKWFQGERPRPQNIDPTGPGQESAWSYPRPPRLDRSPHLVRVEWAGRVIAETRNALRVLETSHPPNYYVPPADVDWSALVQAPGSSLCEWKGEARYWSVRAGGQVVANAAWSYPDPFDDFAEVLDHVSFYCATLQCWVGDERALPQPGGFYGGWVTSHVTGPFKGGPGTQGW
ncbi:MAG: DUF427 domain-containing protein [Myxococcota bacterium]